MSKKNLTRRDFIGKSATGVAGAVVSTGISSIAVSSCRRDVYGAEGREYSTLAFAREVERLPLEEPYAYHRHLSASPVHIPRRNPEEQPKEDEMSIPGEGWKIIWNPASFMILQHAVHDFQDYLLTSQDVRVEIEERSVKEWQSLSQCIMVGTKEQMPGCGLTLESEKAEELVVSPERIIVCGSGERGVMFGLYNLEARMNLREAPFLPGNLNSVRHSLYDTRMVLSWMGWMEFPDRLLSQLAHDGYDGIFASVYANPNGDRTTAESSTEFYARLLFLIRQQDPRQVHDLINRAARFGI